MKKDIVRDLPTYIDTAYPYMEPPSEKFKRLSQTSPTVKDVLLKTWAQDADEMAWNLVGNLWNDTFSCYVFEDGFSTTDVDDAVKHYVTYLNSPAEVEA